MQTMQQLQFTAMLRQIDPHTYEKQGHNIPSTCISS